MLAEQLNLPGKILYKKHFQGENNYHTVNAWITENEQFKSVKEEEQRLGKALGK